MSDHNHPGPVGWEEKDDKAKEANEWKIKGNQGPHGTEPFLHPSLQRSLHPTTSESGTTQSVRTAGEPPLPFCPSSVLLLFFLQGISDFHF